MILKRLNFNRLIALILAISYLSSGLHAQIKSPVEFFGFEPGSDGNLFLYEELVKYLESIDQASDRVKMFQIGQSPQGRPMYIACISSESNLSNLDNLKDYNRQLALDDKLTDSETEKLVKDGKVFVLATLSMHSTEVAPSQSSSLMAYDLATTNDPEKLSWLNNVVFMLNPCHNPDGMDMVVNNYRKFKGTKYEGSSMPGVYHQYVGHDNNRDFVTLSQKDTRAIASIYNLDWFPQVMVEKHQMGSTGVRYFVPPVHDPIAENIDAELWNWTGVFGSNMMRDMTSNGLAGVTQNYLFDDYWPGSTETCLWKNVIGMLTEGASVKVATPVFVEANELQVAGKGLSEYEKSINMPLPWEGGWWHLSDLVKYEMVSMLSILKTASMYREEILRYKHRLTVSEVNKGRSQAPYYFLFPARQNDCSELAILVNLLKEHGVKVYTVTEEVTTGNSVIEKGSVVVPLAQPFRPFIKEVLEAQEFPVRHYTPGGEVIKPYDIASWCLPLHFGVHSVRLDTRLPALENNIREITEEYTLGKRDIDEVITAIFPVSNNESFLAAFTAAKEGLSVSRTSDESVINSTLISKGSFIIQDNRKSSGKLDEIIGQLKVTPVIVREGTLPASIPVSIPRIALVETNFHDMDAGWCRYVLDTYSVPYKTVRPGDFSTLALAELYDVVIFPGVPKSILMEGKYGSDDDYHVANYPPEFTKGMGKEGMAKLMDFTDKGGIIISWEESAGLFEGTLQIEKGTIKEEFQLPYRNISKQLEKSGLYCPGSLIKVDLLPDHPITLGMESSAGVFFRGEPVFMTTIPNFDMDRRVIGTTARKELLMSGYMEKEELVREKPLLIWMKKGQGQFVLFGFNPLFRASTHGTYKLFFNSLLLPKSTTP
jgi:hypothetical protein